MRSVAIIAVALSGLSAAPVAASTYYKAYSHMSPEGTKGTVHSVWFADRLPTVDPDIHKPHKLQAHFENSDLGYGSFVHNKNAGTASLTGIVEDVRGYAYELMVNFMAVEDPGVYKENGSARNETWTFFKIATGSMVTSLNDGAVYDIQMRGTGLTKNGQEQPLAVQLGIGANDKDANKYGLSTWFALEDKACLALQKQDPYTFCNSYRGDINIVLEHDRDDDENISPVPLPAAGWLLLGAVGGLGALNRRRKR